MNRNDYWRKREEEQLKHYLTEEADIQRAMAEKYNYMLYQIQAQINDFYARYARREQITLAEAMQRVSKMDVQAFGAKAKKYVEKRDFSPKANRELRLYNATMRINRLELLKANIGLEMVDGFNDLEHLMDNSLTKRTTDELKRQEEILRRDAGILGESISNNAKTVGSIVNASFNNATWSERIWGNQTQLRNELSSLLTQGLIQGRNPRVLAPALEKMFGVSRRNAERLMATELARVQTDAQMQTFKENDIDEYIFLSMDTACKTCMALNEEHFPVKDAMPGENAPPIHPNCRCSTAAYVDREALEREIYEEDLLAKQEESDILNTQDLLQEDESVSIPKSYVRNYQDFEKLSLSKDEKQLLSDLLSLSQESGFEYGQIVYKGGKTKPFTDRNPTRVTFPKSVYKEEELCFFHAHTNITTLSMKDLSVLTHPGVNSVAVVSANGDVFVARIGNGVRPEEEAFSDKAQADFRAMIDINIMDWPEFFSWTPAERSYMAIRETMYQLARKYGWTLEGGKL